MQLNSVLKIKSAGVEATNVAEGCIVTIEGDNTAGFITVQTDDEPFDLPISGTGKVCDISFEFPYGSDNVKIIITPYNRQADLVAIKAEGELGGGFELNTYTQMPIENTLIYAYQAFQII